MLVEQGATSRNTIQNNVVGLNPSLTGRLTQGTGLDMQWGTWGNLVGGLNPGEGNLFSGNQVESDASRGGIDLSHQAAGNLVIGNFIGTLGDGNSGTSFSANTHGLMIKDDAKTNYIADLGNGRYGVRLNGHDDLFDGNIIANNVAGGVRVVDEYVDNSHSNHPPEQTLRNVLRYNTFYRNGGATPIDITPDGLNPNDQGGGDDGPHRLLNSPVITGLGIGQVYGRACGGCEVQVSVSGRRRGDGTINPLSTNAGVGAAWVGSITADGSGRFSLASEAIREGKRVSTIAIDGAGNTSEMSSQVVPTVPFGIEGNPSASLPRSPAPGIPSLPPPYVSQFPGPFDCSHQNGRLSWTDVGATEYYVFAVTDGNERYLGPQTGSGVVVADADSYRVTQWKFGRAISATCDFSQPAGFSCSVVGGVLSWPDAGASQYFVFATTGGVDRYLGGHGGTTLAVAPADSYRVTYWTAGSPARATCP